MADIVNHFRSEGYRQFQLKVGGDPDTDIKRIEAVTSVLKPGDILVADANTGWIIHQAIRVVNAISNKDIYVEQPCRSLEECLIVRNHTKLPMVIDELILNVPDLIRVYEKGVIDIANIKISRVGGLTKAKEIRDLCESLGIAMTIEDCWGGDIMTSTISHLVASTRPEFYFSSTDFNSYIDLHLAEDMPYRKNGELSAPTGPGLGIHVNEKLLGDPVLRLK
jgi:L-alanine-DL-glutamate epimerase-like enolase superfamily enzyme